VVLPPAIRASTVSSASFAAKESPEACAVIETAPGEELQVDYGTGPMVRDPHTGKYRRTRLFVLTLGYSRKSVDIHQQCISLRADSAREGRLETLLLCLGHVNWLGNRPNR
jgi:hypothetical protein